MKKTPLTIAAIQELHRTGQIDEARQGYIDILKANPNDVTALHLLGILSAEEGDLEAAQNYLEKAKKIEPTNLALSLHLANILKAKGLFSQAAQLLLEVTQLYPDYAAAFNNLGTVYYAQAKLEQAVKAYQTAIDIQPDYVDAYYNLGLALNKLTYTEEAMNAYEALIALAPKHAGGQFQWGCLLMQQNNYAAAIEHFSAIEKEHPFHFETQTNLATCYLKLGMLDKAKAHYLQAAKIMPDDSQVLFNLGVIYMQQEQIEEAIKYYLRTVDIAPDHYDAHNNLGFVFLTGKNNQAALHHFREALRIQPANEAVRHTIDILTQEKGISTSPPAYISSLFDSYADHFDAHLLQSLQYQVPQLFYQIVQTAKDVPSGKWAILDLGCGTGLCGEVFKAKAASLIGVDLSEKMLAVAAQKNSYDELVHADILPFLSNKKEIVDLILAGDVLVYFGDLATLFSAVALALKPRGLFAFNAEIGGEESYRMTVSGRFAHSKSYLDQLAKQNGLKILYYAVAALRTQNQTSVAGHLYLLQRQP